MSRYQNALFLQPDIPGDWERYRIFTRQAAERFGAQTKLSEVDSVELSGPEKRIHTPDGTYPAINVYSSNKGHDPELVCFAEFNPEHTAGQQLHIGVYQNDEEDTKYYAPYRKEES